MRKIFSHKKKFKWTSSIAIAFVFCLNLSSISVIGQAEHSLYMYYSTDGTTFNSPIYLTDSADVPSLAQDSSGKIVCVYQLFKGGMGSATWDKIAVSSSTDDGVSWSAYSLLNITGFTGSNQRAFDPTITITTDGKYRLYFSYCPNSMMLDSTCGTYSAISTDGINFSFEPGIRVEAPALPVIDPAALYFNSEWHYSAPIPPPQGGGARHAVAIDGLNFTVIDSMGQGDTHYKWTGNFLDDGSTMRFYGFGDNVLGNLIWWAESTDGSTWSTYNFTNVTGKDPGVLKLASGDYLMVVPKTSSPLDQTEIVPDLMNVLIYPNPVDQTTTVVLQGGVEKWTWILYNSLGQIVQHIENISSQSITFGRNNLISGMYHYRIRTASGRTSYGKIIME